MTSEWVNASKGSTNNFIEFVTSPNNPDGVLKKALLNGSLTINDHAYYWPHFTAITEAVDDVEAS